MPDAHSLAFERGFPTESGAQSGHGDAYFQAAVKAYRFWYFTLSVEGIFNGNREVGIAITSRSGSPRLGRARSVSRSTPIHRMGPARSISQTARW